MQAPWSVPGTPGPQSAGFFLLRAATLPIDKLTDGTDASGGSDSVAPANASAGLADSRLLHWQSDPLWQAALFLASPKLVEEFLQWQELPGGLPFADMRPRLFQYFLRMATRARTFGLSASVSVGQVGDGVFALGSRAQLSWHSRPDPALLQALVGARTTLRGVRGALTYTANSGLYRVGDGWRYRHSEPDGATTRVRLIGLAASPILDHLIEHTRQPMHFAVLARQLAERSREAPEHEILDFLHELIDMQVLEPALAPIQTAGDPLDRLVAEVAELPVPHRLARRLRALQLRLHRIDCAPESSLRVGYQRLAKNLARSGVHLDASAAFSVNLVRRVPGLALPDVLMKEIGGAAAALAHLSMREIGTPLEQFRERFLQRYGGRVIPLLQALDEDVGIGFDMHATTPEQRDAQASRSATSAAEAVDPRWVDKIPAHLVQRLTRAWAHGDSQIVLEPSDLQTAEIAAGTPLPTVFTVLGSIIPAQLLNPADPLPYGFELHSLRSGIGDMASYAGSDPELDALLRQLVHREDALNAQAPLADVVHLRSERWRRSTCRIPLRSLEITYQGKSGLDPAKQLPARDLLVAVSNGKIRLYSDTLGREIVPRVVDAQRVGATDAMPYRFLAALASQECREYLRFSWGPYADADFLPRLVLGRVVLAPASWRIRAADVAPWFELNSEQQIERIRVWRRDRAIPRWTRIGPVDRLVTVDLENPQCVAAIDEEMRRDTDVRLWELIAPPEQFILRGPEGRHAHDVVLPYFCAAHGGAGGEPHSEQKPPWPPAAH